MSGRTHQSVYIIVTFYFILDLLFNYLIKLNHNLVRRPSNPMFWCHYLICFFTFGRLIRLLWFFNFIIVILFLSGKQSCKGCCLCLFAGFSFVVFKVWVSVCVSKTDKLTRVENYKKEEWNSHWKGNIYKSQSLDYIACNWRMWTWVLRTSDEKKKTMSPIPMALWLSSL